ncbi:MAG: VOC family protein [Cohaesibacter sp.]|nr:VOC family protein [Cohaesibacter sp.]
MARGLDHIVLAVDDLEAARKAYASLGFTVTPINYHPFGTKNALVQLDGAFLELLSVHDETLFPAHKEGFFSFPAFNRDFLKKRQGASMLVLRSHDIEADLEAFRAEGLHVYPRFDFEREAAQADGSLLKVGFSLGFLKNPDMPQMSFFVCQNHYPENFWKKDFQAHANGANKLAAVYLCCEKASAQKAFLSGFSGQGEARSFDGGIFLDTGDGVIHCLEPSAMEALYGGFAAGAGVETAGMAAFQIVTDIDKARACLKNAKTPFHEVGNDLILPASDLFGCALILSAAEQ